MRKIISAVVLCTILLPSGTASAVENGSSAIGSDRIIKTNMMSGSGFLYDDRIIFVQGHSILMGSNAEPKPLSFWTVAPPGTKAVKGKDTYRVVKFFTPADYKPRNLETDWARANDFGILILNKPIKKVSKAKLATKEQIDLMVANGARVEMGGYGYQSYKDRLNRKNVYGISPKKGVWNFAPLSVIEPSLQTVRVEERQINKGALPDYLHYFLLAPYGGPSLCDGDSGAGFYVEDKAKKEILYLGAPGAMVGIPNCQNRPHIPNFTPLIGINPVYRYLDLIKEAEAWVEKH
jgi:hypothetical protein